MLKKLTALMIALVLALGLIPAQAADAPLSAVYRLVSRDAQGQDTLLGCAVLVRDTSTLLTTVEGASAKGGLYAIGDDGEHTLSRGIKPTQDSVLVILTLTEPSAAEPMTLGETNANGVSVLGLDAEGHAVVVPAETSGTVEFAGKDCIQFTAEEGLLPGSLLMDEHMHVVGLLGAALGERLEGYAAVPVDVLAEALGVAADVQILNGKDDKFWLSGVKLSQDADALVVDWTGCDAYDHEDSAYEVFVVDTANTFYAYTRAEYGTTVCRLPALPGRTYIVWVQHAHGEPATDVVLPDEGTMLTTADAAPFDAYDYADSSIYLGTLDNDATELSTDVAVPLTEFTAETLADPDAALFLQVKSSYRVEEISQCSMITSLTTPEGYTFAVAGGFAFDPFLTGGDSWHVSVEHLFNDYAKIADGYTPGTYTLAYYFDGQLVNSVEYVLEDAQ